MFPFHRTPGGAVIPTETFGARDAALHRVPNKFSSP
jgi:hypothetical protein